MMHALIENGKVANVGVVYEGFQPDPQVTLVPVPQGSGVAVGWLFDGQTFSPPPPYVAPVPETVSPRQARLALLGIGMLDEVEQALAAIPGAEGAAARIDWEYATEVQRKSPLIAALGPALGLTAEQIDDLFRSAVTL
jgi:hypothetical protein